MLKTITGEIVDDSRPDENIGQWMDRIGKTLADFPIEEVARIISTPFSWLCVDCGFDTFPGNDGRAHVEAVRRIYQESGNATGAAYTLTYTPLGTEVYTVHQEIWNASGVDPRGGCLCIDCLEKRIGRRLQPSDFDEGGMQVPWLEFCTPRLASRRFRMTRQERRALASVKRRLCG